MVELVPPFHRFALDPSAHSPFFVVLSPPSLLHLSSPYRKASFHVASYRVRPLLLLRLLQHCPIDFCATGLCWKAARVGERLSPYVGAALLLMAGHVLFVAD